MLHIHFTKMDLVKEKDMLSSLISFIACLQNRLFWFKNYHGGRHYDFLLFDELLYRLLFDLFLVFCLLWHLPSRDILLPDVSKSHPASVINTFKNECELYWLFHEHFSRLVHVRFKILGI